MYPLSRSFTVERFVDLNDRCIVDVIVMIIEVRNYYKGRC